MQRISITNPQNIIDGTAKKYYFKLRNTGGPKGDKGDKGDTGATGPQGPQGDPCTVVVNSTATLEPGSNAYVTNTGSLSNAVLNFGIPKGDRGPQGAKGDKGDTGAKGETGPRGPQGERGTNATVYVGTTSTLNPGSQATVYNSGSDSNAVLNFGIPKGEKGDTGSQGPQGPTGQNFAPTIVAELPATGDSSKLYLTPKAHTTQTATGNPITASVTEEAGAIESFQLDGDTYQQTYTGKNIFATGNFDYTNGGIRSIGSNGVINLSGTLNLTWGFNIYGGKNLIPSGIIPAGTYTVSITKAVAFPFILGLVAEDDTTTIDNYTIPAGSTSCTFTTDQPAKRFTLWSNYANHSGEQISVTDLGIMIESGSLATSYEPYVGGVPSPNPDYPQQIQTVTGEQTVEIVGKNKIDTTILQNAWDNNDGISIVYSQQYVRTVEYTPVNASTTYTLSYLVRGSVVMRGNIIQYDSNKSFISSISIANNTTFTTTSSTAFVRLNLYHPDNLAPNDITNLQLELGSTATAYAPYTEQSYPIDLGPIELCKLGTYQDYIYKDGDDWKVHKATELWPITNNSSAKGYTWDSSRKRVYLNPNAGDGLIFSSKVAAVADNDTVFPACANKFVAKTFNNIITDGINGFCLSQSKAMSFRNNAWTNETTARSQLDGTNVIYPLATPTDTTITDTNLIAQLETIRTASLQNGTNTISNTATGSNLAGDMEIGYYGYNPRNRYDKWLWLDLNNNYEKLGS